MSTTNDFRAAAGLKRWPAVLEDLAADDPSAPPRGPGLFEVARADGESGYHEHPPDRRAERAPGSRPDRLAPRGCWACSAPALLYVSFSRAVKYVFAVKQQSPRP